MTKAGLSVGRSAGLIVLWRAEARDIASWKVCDRVSGSIKGADICACMNAPDYDCLHSRMLSSLCIACLARTAGIIQTICKTHGNGKYLPHTLVLHCMLVASSHEVIKS